MKKKKNLIVETRIIANMSPKGEAKSQSRKEKDSLLQSLQAKVLEEIKKVDHSFNVKKTNSHIGPKKVSDSDEEVPGEETLIMQLVDPAAQSQTARVLSVPEKKTEEEVRQERTGTRVYLRERPLTEAEKKDSGSKNISWEITKTGITNIVKNKIYKFDRMYDSKANNLEIFDSAVEQLVWGAMEGYSGDLIFYGQSGTGKTYSLFHSSSNSVPISQMGLETIFAYIEANRNSEHIVQLSFFDIDCESINDLLSDPPAKNLLFEEQDGCTGIKGLSKIFITSLTQAMSLLKKGEIAKYNGISNHLEKKNRSHTIMRITIERKRGEKMFRSILNFIKLAGSESLLSHDESASRRNPQLHRSIVSFSNIIQKLSDNKKVDPLTYKESAITQYLQSGLEGKANLAFICTLSSSHQCYEEKSIRR